MNLIDLLESPQLCPECGGPAFADLLLAEKKDACYHKVRSRYRVWPSAYASGALVQCRKKGAANWGNKNESQEPGLSSINDDDWYEIDDQGKIYKQSGPSSYRPTFGTREIKLDNGHRVVRGMTLKAMRLKQGKDQGVAEGSEQSLSSMVRQDQTERNDYATFVKSQAGGDWSKGAKMYAQLKKRPSNDIFGDAVRLNQFMKMKFDFDKFTNEDWDNYWLLAQHCDNNRDFQKNALSIIKKYQGTDHSHYKYLYDRISMGLTGKQKYGTQNVKDQGVAEGLNDTVYPNATVIKSKNGRPVGEIYQDGNSWGAFHYRADRGYDFLDSKEDAIQALKDLHQETGRGGPDYTFKGVAEGSEQKMSVQNTLAYLKKVMGTESHKDWRNHIINTNEYFVLKDIPVNSLRSDLSGLDKANVEKYKQMDFSKAPPIVIGSDGNILDGYHRVNVAKALKVPTLKAWVGVKKKGVAEGLNEMDKSAPQPGRDGKVSHSTYGSRDKKGSDYFKGKEAPGKAITAKQASKDALDILKKQGLAEGKMAELEMDLEDPEITDRQFEKMYGMTRKEAREQFSQTDMWAFPEIRDPNRPLHERGVAEEFGPLPKDNQQIRLGRHTVDIERVGLNNNYISFAWNDSKGQEHYEEVPVGDLGSYDDLIKKIKQEISYQERKYTDQGVAEGLDQPKEAGKAIQSLQNLALMKSALTMTQLMQAGRESIVTNALAATAQLEQNYKKNNQLGNAIFVRALRDEIDNFKKGYPINASFPESDNASELGDLLQGKLGKVNFQQGVAEGPNEKIGGRHDPDDFDDMVRRLKKLAGAGPMQTQWDPKKRVYRNMPTAVQPPKHNKGSQ